MSEIRDPRAGRCPDGGHCHSVDPCEPGACYRVKVAGPLSGVHPGDRWPAAPEPMPEPEWSIAWTELSGYVEEARADGGTIDPAVLADYMAELKERHVTGPIRAWMKRLAGDQ